LVEQGAALSRNRMRHCKKASAIHAALREDCRR
jgi:hypothetical protein